MTPVANFFTNEEVAYALAGAVVLVALFVATWFILSLWPFRRELDFARRRLESIPGPAEFATEFDEVSEEFKKTRYVGSEWEQFEKTLVLPGSGRRRVEAIRSTRRAADALTLEALVKGKVNLAFFESVPNLFVGFGLLLTFLALASGIELARPALTGAGGDPVAGLDRLFGGAFLAFLKSSFALLVSILLILIEKRYLHTTESKVAAFCKALDDRLIIETSETLAGEQLDELRQQTSELKRFNDGLSGALGDALDTRVTQALTPVLERLIESVQDLKAERAQSNEKFLVELLSGFKRSMSEAAGGEFGQMATALQEMRTVLGGTATALATGQRELEASTARISAALEQTLTANRSGLAAELAHMNQVIEANLRGTSAKLAQHIEAGGKAVSESFGAQTQRISENIQRLESLTRAWDELTARTSDMSVKATELTRAQEQSLAAMRAVSAEVLQLGAALRTAVSQVAQAANAQAGLTTRVEAATADITRAVTASQEHWRSYEGRFSETDQALARVFEQLDQGLARFSEKMVEYVQSVEGHLSKATGSLSEAVSTLGSDLEMLPEQVQKLGGHVEGLREILIKGPQA
jgi:hypothetical protein